MNKSLETIEDSVYNYTKSKHKFIEVAINQSENNKYRAVTEADIENRSKEISQDIAKRITKLDEIKAKLSSDNLVYLQTYETTAKACNPVGLTIKNYTVIDGNKFDKLYKQAMDMINSKEKEAMKIQNIPEIKDWIKTNISQDGIYKMMYTIIYDQNKPNTKKFISKDKDHKVTKTEILSAIKLLKGAGDEFVVMMEDLKKQQRFLESQLSTNTNSLQFKGGLNSDIDEYKTTIKLNLISLRKILITHCISAKTKYAKIYQANARLIVKKAAKYNPRTYKESTMIMEDLDDEFESIFSDIVFDEE